MKTKILILIVIIIAVRINAETRFVSKTGTSIPPYTSWATAADRIQKAINICKPGDTVYVGNGVYQDTVRMTPGIALIGSGMDSCIIDTREINPEQKLISVTIQDSCLIKGFKIITGRTTYIELVRISIFPPLRIYPEMFHNCVIEYNAIDWTNIGMGLNQINGIVRNNSITNCDEGIELWPFYDSVHITIKNNYLYNFQGGIRVAYGKFDIINNVFIMIDPWSIDAVVGGAGGTCWLYNNIVISKGDNFAGFYNSTSPTYMYNNLFYGEFTYQCANLYNNHIAINNLVINSTNGFNVLKNYTPPLKYNNVWNVKYPYTGITPDSTNISCDPMLVNEDSLDFHLQMFSPLIHAGDPDIKNIDGSRSDIGPFGGPYGETYTYKDKAPRPPVNLTGKIEHNLIKLKWNKNTEADFNLYKIYFDTTSGFIPRDSNLLCSTADTFFASDKISFSKACYKISAIDKQGNESKCGNEICFNISDVKDNYLVPGDYILYQNYPNPFNPSTIISYNLKESSYVKIYVYDISGKIVSILENGIKEAGYHETVFSINSKKNSALASGIYICKIDAYKDKIPVFTDSKKMMLIK